MIAFSADVKVWIAGGVTDMRRAMNTLALQVQQGIGRDPYAGEIFCFRGRKGDLVKILWHDGVGMSLYAKRLEAGKSIWPVSRSGDAVASLRLSLAISSTVSAGGILAGRNVLQKLDESRLSSCLPWAFRGWHSRSWSCQMQPPNSRDYAPNWPLQRLS